jgi:peptide/nickel transport system permease protein
VPDVINYILRRLALALLTIWLASLGVFLAIQALPGDVATQILGQNATPKNVALLRAELGLDKPAWSTTPRSRPRSASGCATPFSWRA